MWRWVQSETLELEDEGLLRTSEHCWWTVTQRWFHFAIVTWVVVSVTRPRGLHWQILLTASDLCIRWMQVSYCSPAYGLSSSHSAVDWFFVVDAIEDWDDVVDEDCWDDSLDEDDDCEVVCDWEGCCWLLFPVLISEFKTHLFFATTKVYPSKHKVHALFCTTWQFGSSNLQTPFLNANPSLHESHESITLADSFTQFESRHFPLLKTNGAKHAIQYPESLS